VSAHHAAGLYSVFHVRWDSGREATAAYLSGSGRGIGPWEDTMLDLEIRITRSIPGDHPLAGVDLDTLAPEPEERR
ncbi:MAG TPA: hypothetical protein VMY78_07110, partial [Solirubrobacteraceae bacterium]|nr:hypothetical protein [Solirubrobacteraceae bacterium]